MKKWGFLPLFLFLITVAVYANSLFSGFVWDDKPLIIAKQEFFSHPENALALLALPDVALGTREKPPYYRPLDTLSYMLDHYLWGLNPFWYHLENVLLHALVVVLFYLLLMEVFENRKLAFFAATLFAVYPVNTESVNFVSARNTIFCAAFSLASLLFLAKSGAEMNGGSIQESGRANMTNKKSLASVPLKSGGAKWIALAFLAYFLALFSKEPAVVLPFFLLSFGFVSCEQKFKVKKTVLAGFFAITAIYFVIRHLVLGAFIANYGMSFSLSRFKFITAVYFEHFRLFVYPFKLNALYTEQKIVFSPLKAAAAICGVLFLLYFSLNKKSPAPVRAGAQWIFWGLLPVSNLVKIPSAPIAERFQYTIIFGFVLILGYLVEKLALRKAVIGMAVLLALAIILGARTFERNFVWRDDISLYNSMIRSDPWNGTAYFNLGNDYGERGDLESAVTEFRTALAKDPELLKARVNLGVAYAKEGRMDEAAQEFRSALAKDPGYIMARVDLGTAYMEKGLLPDAIRELRVAVSMGPSVPGAHLALGMIYEKAGLPDDAASEFQTVLKLDPGNEKALKYLAGMKGGMAGQ